MFLPPSCTALMQPMDQSDIRILKLNYRKIFSIAILSSSENRMEAFRTLSLKNVAFLIAYSWDRIDANILKKYFNKILYDEKWYSDNEIPLSRLRRSDSTELVDLLVNLEPDIYNFHQVTECLNDEIETTDEEAGENNDHPYF